MQNLKLVFVHLPCSYFAGFQLERKLFISNLTYITNQNVALKEEPGVFDLLPRSLLFSANISGSEGSFNPNFSWTF